MTCKRTEYDASYYARNKEKIDKKNKEYAIKNKDKIKKQNAERYLKNKEAFLKRSKDRYKKNEERIKKQSAQRYARNKDKNHIKMLLQGAKKRAKDHNMVFNLEPSDIIIPQICPLLGIPLFRGDRTNNPNSPSIDRINNSLGYEKGNIHIISKKANTIKNNASLEELAKIGEWAKSCLC